MRSGELTELCASGHAEGLNNRAFRAMTNPHRRAARPGQQERRVQFCPRGIAGEVHGVGTNRPTNGHPDPTCTMTQVQALPARWRDDAHVLHRRGDERGAGLLRTLAGELDEAVRATADQILTLTEAAQRSGRAVDTVRKAVSQARLPNAGRKGKPRVRAGDVERVFPRNRVAASGHRTYDPTADARSLLGGRGV